LNKLEATKYMKPQAAAWEKLSPKKDKCVDSKTAATPMEAQCNLAGTDYNTRSRRIRQMDPNAVHC